MNFMLDQVMCLREVWNCKQNLFPLLFGIFRISSFFSHLALHTCTHTGREREREKWEKGPAYLSANHSLETAIPTRGHNRAITPGLVGNAPKANTWSVRGPSWTVFASPELSSNISETVEKFYFVSWEFKSLATSLQPLADFFTSLQFLSINK